MLVKTEAGIYSPSLLPSLILFGLQVVYIRWHRTGRFLAIGDTAIWYARGLRPIQSFNFQRIRHKCITSIVVLSAQFRSDILFDPTPVAVHCFSPRNNGNAGDNSNKWADIIFYRFGLTTVWLVFHAPVFSYGTYNIAE